MQAELFRREGEAFVFGGRRRYPSGWPPGERVTVGQIFFGRGGVMLAAGLRGGRGLTVSSAGCAGGEGATTVLTGFGEGAIHSRYRAGGACFGKEALS